MRTIADNLPEGGEGFSLWHVKCDSLRSRRSKREKVELDLFVTLAEISFATVYV